jgi:hypothetical protein
VNIPRQVVVLFLIITGVLLIPLAVFLGATGVLLALAAGAVLAPVTHAVTTRLGQQRSLPGGPPPARGGLPGTHPPGALPPGSFPPGSPPHGAPQPGAPGTPPGTPPAPGSGPYAEDFAKLLDRAQAAQSACQRVLDRLTSGDAALPGAGEAGVTGDGIPINDVAVRWLADAYESMPVVLDALRADARADMALLEDIRSILQSSDSRYSDKLLRRRQRSGPDTERLRAADRARSALFRRARGAVAELERTRRAADLVLSDSLASQGTSSSHSARALEIMRETNTRLDLFTRSPRGIG